jgi:uncharacterized protein YcbX
MMTVEALWRFPVKSMAGEMVATAEVTELGIVGDHGYALIDKETGKLVSAKNPKRWPDIMSCRATYLGEPRIGEQIPAVRIDLADGTSTSSDEPDSDTVISTYFDRDVALSRPRNTDYAIEEYVADLANVRPDGHRDELTQIKTGAALFRDHGLSPLVADGTFFDLMPVSILTTATLTHLAELAPGSRFDHRRFRMNVIVATPESGFVENDWVGKSVTVGDQVQLHAALPCPRCVMTNLAQDDLPRDANILEAAATHNRRDIAGQGLYPCVGVYAVVGSPGTIREGDEVSVA